MLKRVLHLGATRLVTRSFTARARSFSSEIVRDMPRRARPEFGDAGRCSPPSLHPKFISNAYMPLNFRERVPKDHPLDKLFGGLSTATKHLVKRRWNAMVAHDPMFKANSARPGRSQKHSIPGLGAAEGGLAFMRYRYAYEGRHRSHALGNLPDVLRDAYPGTEALSGGRTGVVVCAGRLGEPG